MICPNCDRKIEDDAQVCEYCGKPLPEPEEEEVLLQQETAPEGKPLMGFLGATAGAILSCLVVVLLPKFGLSAYFGGIVVPFAIFVGYSLLCKGKTKSGLGVCIMFTLLTPYVAHQINGVTLLEGIEQISGIPVNELSFYEKFLLVPTAVELDAINVIEYFMDLFKLYIFVAAGTVAYVGGVMRARKKKKMQAARHL